MKGLSWKLASLAQLYDIVFYDRECNQRFKIEAMAEIKRRNQAKMANIRYREKRRYYG